MRREIQQVDAFTGEVLEGAVLAIFHPKRKNGFQKGGWVAMSQGPLVKLAQAGIGDQAIRVFLVLVGQLDFENYINVSQAEVGRLLSMDRAHVNRAFKRLVDEGVLVVGPKVGRNGTYRLDPSYAWKGSAKGHHEALAERIKAAGLRVVEGGE